MVLFLTLNGSSYFPAEPIVLAGVVVFLFFLGARSLQVVEVCQHNSSDLVGWLPWSSSRKKAAYSVKNHHDS
jgi:hypothetical protein